MYIIIDDRESVTSSYATSFDREGIAFLGFWPDVFQDWLCTADAGDLAAVDAFLLGDCEKRTTLPALIRRRIQSPIIGLNNVKSLKATLELFACGVDDVVNAPVHPSEVLVRAAAIRRRGRAMPDENSAQPFRVYFDGRDPTIGGEVMILPRRELRILEYMVSHQGKWISKSQIFNAIYGIFNADLDESVVESHMSKLRKKLRTRLGYDLIQSKRYVGYKLIEAGAPAAMQLIASEPKLIVNELSQRKVECELLGQF
jgi:DNA-binding response OmpR family regulator